jgi:tetratricopeptide (TPR) repeat protein
VNSRSSLARGFHRAAAIVLLAAAPGFAREPSEEEAVGRSAELFREGRALVAQQRFEEACQKFEASLQLERSPGTLLNIGSCRVREGRLLEGVETFRAAIEQARAEPPSEKVELWVRAAEQHIAALEARLAELTLELAVDAGSEVRVDGRPAAAGVPLVLDPGVHEVRVAAAGKRELVLPVELAEGQRLKLKLPELEDARAAGAKPLPVSPPPAASSAAELPDPELPDDGVWKWALLSGGAVVFASGAAAGWIAIQERNALERDCPDKQCPEGSGWIDEAENAALAADVLMGVGLVTTAAAAALLWWDRDDAGSTVAPRAAAACDATGCGVALRGRF